MDCWQNSVEGYSGPPQSCQQYGVVGYGRSQPHRGRDLGAPAGTPVRAVANGWIVAVGLSDTAGTYVIQGVATPGLEGTVFIAYFHLQSPPQRENGTLLEAGNAVAVGEQIGLVGCTGSCTGPHLHLQFQDIETLPAAFCQTYDPRVALPCSGGAPHLVRGDGCP